MATIGAKNLYAAAVEEDTYEGTTFGAFRRIAGLINISMNPDVAEASLYADDVLDEHDVDVTGMEVSINVKDLDAEQETFLLGSDYVTLAFLSELSSNSEKDFRAVLIFKVKFRPPEENFDTKADSITYNTPTITGKALPLNSLESEEQNIDKIRVKDDIERLESTGTGWATALLPGTDSGNA